MLCTASSVSRRCRGGGAEWIMSAQMKDFGSHTVLGVHRHSQGETPSWAELLREILHNHWGLVHMRQLRGAPHYSPEGNNT